MKSMKELFETAKSCMDRKQDFVFVTTISSSGSSPRGAGSKMLVMADGTSYGTIGGGNVEYVSIQHAREVLVSKTSHTRGFQLNTDQVADLGMICGGNVLVFFQYISWENIQHAREVLVSKTSHTRGFQLNTDQVADLGMICGGNVLVFFQYISWENKEFYELCARILSDWGKNENSWLILDITDETAWAAGYYHEKEGLTGLNISSPAPLLLTKAVQVSIDGHLYYSEPLVQKGRVPAPLLLTKAVQVSIDGHLYYSEPLVQKGRVYIFGGGHVAQALVPVLSRLDFRCVVYDDREMFCNFQVFPDAEQCILGDFTRISEYLSVEPQDYVCIMSRGHEYDYMIQKQMLRTPAHYIGVMGSRRKKEIIQKKLLQDGFSAEEISRIITPIGLDIQAETPAEISISIAGQLIQERSRFSDHMK